jgi:GT2 family glycosyltransferase
MYFEEPDLCRRLLEAGWSTHFAPVTDVIHVEGASTQQVRHDMLWEWAVSYARYNERHFSGLHLAAARLMFRVGMRIRWCREHLRSMFVRDAESRATFAGNAAVWSRAMALGSAGELAPERSRAPQ